MYRNKFKLRNVVAIAICLAGFSIGNVLAQTSTTDHGVVINGVKWATRNVDKPGTFAEKPESSGMFYQWNRIRCWNTTDWTVNRWDSSKNDGAIWEKSNDPSPEGWRIPTFEEIEKLLDKEKVNITFENVNGEWGNVFTDKATGNSIFMPFVGTRDRSNGSKSTLGCGYWSSTQKNSDSVNLLFLIANQATNAAADRNIGNLVRCVAE